MITFPSHRKFQGCLQSTFGVATIALVAVTSLTGCDQFADAVDNNKSALDVPVTTKYTFQTAMDIGAVTGKTAGQKAITAIDQNISVPATNVDLVKEVPALANARGRIKSFEITKIDALPSANSVTGVLPAFDLYIGAHGNKDLTKAVKIATIPAIPPKSKAVVSATIHKSGMAAAQPFLTTLKFSQQMVARLVVAQGGTVPGGKVQLAITMAIKAVLNPIN